MLSSRLPEEQSLLRIDTTKRARFSARLQRLSRLSESRQCRTTPRLSGCRVDILVDMFTSLSRGSYHTLSFVQPELLNLFIFTRQCYLPLKN
ncbi:hypothetical protein FPOAC1_008304 [Fusarium poae]|uniref:hypothetical protein n=1 Tax=Fusarium poae TaxID=36050 RepID=UPI001CEAD3FC|nr:hypothetical protein FPOAC1_008304 [Fusarium poae]KAG8668920.1 hypothetical protein FPOAC1_008304 [Fusarium poae]